MDSLGTQLMVVLTISRVPRLLGGWARWLVLDSAMIIGQLYNCNSNDTVAKIVSIIKIHIE